MREDNRRVVDAIMRVTLDTLQEQIRFIVLDDPDQGAMHAKFMKSPMATANSSGMSEHVGIFFDVKLSGEPSCQPAQLVSPVRKELYENLIKMAIRRKNQDPRELPDGDLYFIFDGGKRSAATREQS